MSHRAGSHYDRPSRSRPCSRERDRQHRPHQGQRSHEHSPERYKSRPISNLSAHLIPNNAPASGVRSRASSPPQTQLQPRSTARRKNPPFPYVEDELRGVANLRFSPSLENPPKVIDPFDVPNRGTINQTQLLIPVESPRATPQQSKAKGEDASRRDSKIDSPFMGAQGRQPSHPKLGNEDERRPVTPQSWSRSASPGSVFTPSSSDISANSRVSSSSSGSKTLNNDDARRKGFAPGAQGSRTPNRYSYSGSLSRENFAPRDVSRRSSPGLSNNEREDAYSLASRGSYETTASKARASPDEFAQPIPRRKLYVQSAELPDRRNGVVSAGSQSSYPRSRPASPASPASPSAKFTPSPPRSPHAPSAGLGTYFDMPAARSARSSVSESTAGSRPTSPTTSRPPSRDWEGIRRASTFPLQGYMETRSRPTSLLANTATHIDDVPSPTLPYPLHSSSSNAPYPMDNAITMPDSDNHRYRPVSRDDIDVPRQAANQTSPWPISMEMPIARPELKSRRTANGALPTLQTFPALTASSQMSSSRSGSVASSPVTSKRSLGKCLDMQSTRDFRDWSVLRSDSRVKMCPNCVVKTLHPASYETHVRTTTQTEADPRVRCCFKDKWQRLAFSVTEYRGWTNLDLLSAIAALHRHRTLDACPGSGVVTQRWVVAHMGRRATPSFYICPCDAAKIDKLFPRLRHSFRDDDELQKTSCRMGSDTARFDNYARELDKAHEEAIRTGAKPDLTKLDDLAKLMDQTPECSRDAFVRDGFWHYAPGLPDFTVCAECYATVVWPASSHGKSVAKRISGSERRLDKEHSKGHSCQLHSRWMLHVFHKAVEKNDFEYLAERAKERAGKERDIKARWDDLSSKRDKLRSQDQKGYRRDDQIAEIDRGIADLGQEWLRYE